MFNWPGRLIPGVILLVISVASTHGQEVTREQIKDFVKAYRAKRIGPEKEAMWKRGASNAGYHYLGCAKTFALMGRAFAEAALDMESTK